MERKNKQAEPTAPPDSAMGSSRGPRDREVSPADSPRPKETPPRARITITSRTGGSVTLPPPADAPSTLDPLITETDHAPDPT